MVILAFLFSQFGPYLTFKAQQYWVKKEIKTRIKNGVPQSELISFDANQLMNSKEFVWEKLGKEFFFKGNLYDIVSATSLNGKFIFKCINDKQEKQLFANLEHLVKKQNETDKNDQKNQSNYFFSLYDFNAIKEFAISSTSLNQNTFYKSQKLVHIFCAVLTPPPNC